MGTLVDYALSFQTYIKKTSKLFLIISKAKSNLLQRKLFRFTKKNILGIFGFITFQREDTYILICPILYVALKLEIK